MLVNKAKRVNEGIQEIINDLIRREVTMDTFKDMSANDLKLIRKCKRLLDDLTQYQEAEAKMLETIDDKLNKLLYRQNTRK